MIRVKIHGSLRLLSQIPRVAVAIAQQAGLQGLQGGVDGGVAESAAHPHQGIGQHRVHKNHVRFVSQLKNVII